MAHMWFLGPNSIMALYRGPSGCGLVSRFDAIKSRGATPKAASAGALVRVSSKLAAFQQTERVQILNC